MNEILITPQNIPKPYVDLLDQIFEIERKIERIKESNSIARNLSKMKDVFANIFVSSLGAEGLIYDNPMGESYSETRTDLEASIAGTSTEKLVVTEVIKPIIRYQQGGNTFIVRKGVVVVESQNK